MSTSEALEEKTFWEEWRGFFIFIALMFAFRIAIADWNHVPSGSMRPTLIEGDRIWL
ncbi:MAG: S26 family signal peptidase, partial [Pseudomonadota bacterium]